MKTQEKLIGRKVRGFKFETTKYCSYVKGMDKYVGKTGIINKIVEEVFRVDFENDFFFYPADQIEAHLVEDEIPTLSDGVMMLVSDNNLKYDKEEVFFKYNNKHYVRLGLLFEPYEFAKPLEPTKEEQLTAILGSSEKVSEIMELFKNE